MTEKYDEVYKFLKKNVPCNENDYIAFFFKNIANIIVDEPIFEKLSNIDFDNIYISIVKDTVDRLDNSRHLAQRNFRNCFFCFIEKEKWKKTIGYNNDNPLDAKSNSSKLESFVSKGIHNYLKGKHIAWYIHSYAYIVLVFIDEDEIITKDSFSIYYWNTNFSFKRFPNKTEIFGNTRYVKFVNSPNDELVLIESKDKELIDCVRAFEYGDKDFDLFELTNDHFLDVCYEIDEGIEYSLIEGPARSGKTILAMLLMNKYQECKLLLLNYTFFKDLKMAFKTLGLEFPSDRIFHHNFSNNGRWITNHKSLEFVTDFSFLIIDEAQRMSRLSGFCAHGYNYPAFDPFLAIKNIENHKHTIFLGDNLQRINNKHDEGFDVIRKYYLDKRFREHRFYQTIGIPDSVVNNILFLLGFEGKQPNNPGEYDFESFDNVNDFTNKFQNDLSKRKHYVSLAIRGHDTYSFGNNPTIISLPEAYSSKINYLFNEEIVDKYYLSPYEIISREAESIYLFIPDFVNRLDYKNSNNKYSDTIYYQLYTLMTRATASLNIYAENENLRRELKEKIAEIRQSKEFDESIKSFDYDVFIAYHGTNSDKGTYPIAKKLCDKLTESGFRVYLHGYSCNREDEDVGFNETTRIIQKSKSLIGVVNDYVPTEPNGMLLRRNEDGGLNQFYQELKTFYDLINVGFRNHKYGFRFFYCGNKTGDDIFTFLNNLYLELTYGFNCIVSSDDDALRWVMDYKEYND